VGGSSSAAVAAAAAAAAAVSSSSDSMTSNAAWSFGKTKPKHHKHFHEFNFKLN